MRDEFNRMGCRLFVLIYIFSSFDSFIGGIAMPTLGNTTQIHRNQRLAWKIGRFLRHLVEMLLVMGAGMGIFHVLAGLIPASSSLTTVADSEKVVHIIVMDLFMTAPMLAWMILRGHGWQHSLEMAVAMLAPMAAVTLLCKLGAVKYLPWLLGASGPAMLLGMMVAMLYRRDHYTGKAVHSAHAA